MDEIDLFILKKLLENSRLTYRDLADMKFSETDLALENGALKLVNH